MLSEKNKVFSHCIVNHYRCKYISAKGVGSEETESPYKASHQHGAEKDTDTGDSIKKKYLKKKVIFPTLKDPENVGDIRHHIREKKSDEVSDHRITGSSGIAYFPNRQFEKLYCEIACLQRRKKFPPNKVKNDDMGASGEPACKSVFDELQKSTVIDGHMYWEMVEIFLTEKCCVYQISV